MRTRFDDQASLQSSWGDSSDDDDDVDDDEYQGSVGHPVDWTVVREHDGKFTRVGPSSAGASEHAGDSHVDNEPPRGSRRSQSVGTSWLITSPQPGLTDTRLIPSYGGHIAKVIFEGSERTPQILECHSRKKPLEAIFGLRDLSDALYDVLPATPLSRLPYIMHQHIDSALVSAFVERWQPDTNTFHMPSREMTIMLHDVQRILGIGIKGSHLLVCLGSPCRSYNGMGYSPVVASTLVYR